MDTGYVTCLEAFLSAILFLEILMGDYVTMHMTFKRNSYSVFPLENMDMGQSIG